MHRRAFISLPPLALLLSGCSLHDKWPAEVFGAYLSVLAGLQPVPESLQPWDQPPFVLDRPPSGSLRLVVESRVRPFSPHDWKTSDDVLRALPGVHRSAALNLMQRQAFDEPVRLPAVLPANVAVNLVDPQVLRSLFREGVEDGWALFSERFPRSVGIASFSSAGLSADGQQAVFIFEHSCGPLCGTGNAVLMRRAAAGWVLQDHRGLWIS